MSETTVLAVQHYEEGADVGMLNAALDALAADLGQSVAIDVDSGGLDLSALTDANGDLQVYRARAIELTAGSISGAEDVTLPEAAHACVFWNNTGQALTFTTASATAEVVLQDGQRDLIWVEDNDGGTDFEVRSLLGAPATAGELAPATVETTDNTETTLLEVALASGETVTIWGFGQAEDGAGDTADFEFRGTAQNAAGTTTLKSKTRSINPASGGSAANWTIDLDADDTADSIRLRVTGENSHTIQWSAVAWRIVRS